MSVKPVPKRKRKLSQARAAKLDRLHEIDCPALRDIEYTCNRPGCLTRLSSARTGGG